MTIATARRRSSLWRLLFVLLAALLVDAGGWAGGWNGALAADAYVIRGIDVDATAADAVSARTQAMDEAQAEGLRRLMGALSEGGTDATLPSLEGVDLDRYVRSIDVEKEQVAATRYVATLAVAYDRDAVDRLMQGARAPVVLRPTRPLLVVPVVEGNAPGDAWAAAWRADDLGLGLLDVVVAQGDAGIDEAALRDLAARNGTDDAVVVEAGPLDPNEPEGPVAYRLVEATGWPKGPIEGRAVAVDGGDPYRLAAEQALARLEEAWKKGNLVRLDRAATLSVRVPLAGLREWVQIRRGMERLPEIREVVIDALSQREATLRLRYVGGREQLLDALARQGLRLSRELDGWRLQRAAVPDGDPLASFG
ncbi:MAG: DUF2066 domain-containing protein [Geminicoccaceae bacterium]|nr:DUF2066 domain-containing protein [Geminicoccaceae bacterium]